MLNNRNFCLFLRRYNGLFPMLQAVALSQFLYFYISEFIKKVDLTGLKQKNAAQMKQQRTALESFIGSTI